MAEPDSAGPAPSNPVPPRRKASRPLSLAAAMRRVERETAPLRAEIEKAKKYHEQFRAWGEPARRMLAQFGLDEEEEAPPPPPVKASEAPAPRPKPEPAGRPAFEVTPGEKLLAALRQAFPGFKATDRWWIHAEHELKNAHKRSDPEGHEAFCAAYRNWSAEDLIRHLEAEGRIKPASAPRGKSVCERLREIHKEDADFTETAPERELAIRIGKKSPGCFSKSHYWNTVLKPRRAELRARAQLLRAGIRSNAAEPSKAQARADNWDQRDAVRRLDAQIDGGH